MTLPSEADTITTPVVFPFVHFTSVEGQEFGMPRDHVLHYETYHEKDKDGNKVFDHDRTFVNFVSPNHNSKGSLHAIVDMPLQVFRNCVMRPAYDGEQPN